MFSVVNELLQTRRELNELKEQLRIVSQPFDHSNELFSTSLAATQFHSHSIGNLHQSRIDNQSTRSIQWSNQWTPWYSSDDNYSRTSGMSINQNKEDFLRYYSNLDSSTTCSWYSSQTSHTRTCAEWRWFNNLLLARSTIRRNPRIKSRNDLPSRR